MLEPEVDCHLQFASAYLRIERIHSGGREISFVVGY